MQRPRFQFPIRRLIALVATSAFVLGYVHQIITQGHTDDRFMAWLKRSIAPPGSPWLHISHPALPPFPILGSGERYVELVTPPGRTIVVRARLGPGDRITRVTLTSEAGRTIEVPPGDADAGRPLDCRALLPEAFR